MADQNNIGKFLKIGFETKKYHFCVLLAWTVTAAILHPLFWITILRSNCHFSVGGGDIHPPRTGVGLTSTTINNIVRNVVCAHSRNTWTLTLNMNMTMIGYLNCLHYHITSVLTHNIPSISQQNHLVNYFSQQHCQHHNWHDIKWLGNWDCLTNQKLHKSELVCSLSSYESN